MENKKYYLFLDDVRYPKKNMNYMQNHMYEYLDWEIVRTYDQFVNYVTEHGLPEIVSFDHDLAEAHYHESMYQGGKVYMKYLETISEKTGLDCAKWLTEYCQNNGKSFPIWIVHSMNPVGKTNIESYISNYLKHVEGKE